MSEKKVQVTLIRSTAGKKPKHRATLRALGLRKRGATREHTYTPVIAGMIKQVDYMLEVKEV
ncbi:MAG: 50S ribosomal protein L30 [Leptospiraceae bacterium]|nr:50S ribosomal protein L30 [Leptospiraceae bacterium]MCB1317775.1 50S ribosomal protein L30 [Leptospiraceae bacterium]MCB1321933.1 50S ribosomal protein L30 [Leptospiraceae bacterium]